MTLVLVRPLLLLNCRKCFLCKAFVLFPLNKVFPLFFPEFWKGLSKFTDYRQGPLAPLSGVGKNGYFDEKINPSVTN